MVVLYVVCEIKCFVGLREAARTCDSAASSAMPCKGKGVIRQRLYALPWNLSRSPILICQ